MRVLIFSDVHANINALEAVLDAAGDVDATWCLGDLVGYGPDPNECINRVRIIPNLICVLGNHDAAALGKIKLDAFNSEARRSVNWMQETLSKENLLFLFSLNEIQVVDDVTLTHGSPRNPIWEYILDISIAKDNFNFFSNRFCIVGHTHIPLGFFQIDGSEQLKWKLLEMGESLKIVGRAILNPGSVGQPRDRDMRAAYAIYNTEENTWETYRVYYNISEVQKRINMVGLPARNALRLAGGW